MLYMFAQIPYCSLLLYIGIWTIISDLFFTILCIVELHAMDMVTKLYAGRKIKKGLVQCA